MSTVRVLLVLSSYFLVPAIQEMAKLLYGFQIANPYANRSTGYAVCSRLRRLSVKSSSFLIFIFYIFFLFHSNLILIYSLFCNIGCAHILNMIHWKLFISHL